jgi:hypothetical protein
MAKNTIKVKSYLNILDEKTAAAAITPGMLVERTSANKVQAHSTAGGTAQKLFALEDENQGRGITDAYNTTTYAHVKLWAPVPGERVYAILDSDSGATAATIGAFVESKGDGRLRVVTEPASAGVLEIAGSIVGVCVEAQATPGGRFTVEIV